MRSIPLSCAVLGLALSVFPSAVCQAQVKIYWTVSGSVWSMNPDGSGQANVFPNGLVPPAPFTNLNDVAGPSVGQYQLSQTAPAAHCFIASVSTADGSVAELFAFAPDGHGGSVWQQLTNLSGSGYALGNPRLPNDGTDAFASCIIQNATGSPPGTSIVTLANPFTTTTPVGPSGITTVYSPSSPDSVVLHTWSPTSQQVAFRLDHTYPNGSSGLQLVVYSLASGQSTVLVDQASSGYAPNNPAWSAGSSNQIAFVNDVVGTSEGVYTVPATGGSVKAVVNASRGGGGFLEYYSPVWSPDSTALALWDIHSQFAWNNFVSSAVAKVPVSAKKSSITVLTTQYPWANRAIPFAWR